MLYILLFVFIVVLAFLYLNEVIKRRRQYETLSWVISGMQQDYEALDQGMQEMGESMTAEELDHSEKEQALQRSIDFASDDRLRLYKIALRCHQSCLPTVHGWDAEELQIMDLMHMTYGDDPKEIEPLFLTTTEVFPRT